MTHNEERAPTRVFLSYAVADAARAEQVARVLGASGCEVLAVKLDVRPGNDFLAIFDHATATADAVIVLISRNYVGTAGFSRNDWITCTIGRRTPVVPIVLDDVDAPYYLGPFEVLRADSLSSGQIRRVIRREPLEPYRGAQGIQDLLAASSVPSVEEPAKQGADLTAPIWNVPLDSKTYFTGRNDLLKLLYREAMTARSAILTHGLTGQGGVGKSRLAAEYAHRHRQEYDLVWWIRSSAQSAMDEDLARLGEELGVWTPSGSKWRDAGTKVREWLETTERRWLLVFDDVAEPEIVQQALPSKGHGHVLITARSPSNVPSGARRVYVDVLPPDDAAEFLLSRTGATDKAGVHRLARELGYLALALEQASAYIAATGTGFGDYLRLVARYRRRLNRKFSRPNRLRRGMNQQRATDGLVASCMLAIDKVTKLDPLLRRLLEFFSFLETSPVELSFLRRLEPELRFSLRPLQTLSRYALIEFSADQSAVVHPLVQRVVRSQMTAEAQDATRSELLGWVEQAFPEAADDRRFWRVCGSLAPHAAAILQRTDKDSIRAAQLVLHRLGKYLYSRGDSRSSLVYLQRAASSVLQSRLSSVEISDTILNDLAVVWADEGDWAQAVQVGVEIFQRRLEAVGQGEVDAPLVTFANNLAAALADSGRLVDAQAIYSRLHANLEVAPSLDSQIFAALVTARHNWASVLDELGDFDAAESIYREVLSDKTLQYGYSHPETVVSLLGLAQVLRKKEDYRSALALAESAFKCAERALGEYHPQTLSALDLLAAVSDDSGYSTASFVFAERAYARRMDAVGTRHPSTVDALHNLASITRRAGDQGQARLLFENLVEILTSTLGPNHPETVGAVQEMSSLHEESDSSGASRILELVETKRSTDKDDGLSSRRRRLFLDQVEVLD
ncbi:FxSxx-COOH system tetratricopeptide repeat protein [Micromonospora aurantiaca]|uniref:FxSxx-COOH system tetratricopeptide repeat protein n=1 Tax=Micromonospora aurantiaca (nom. illeg.) TaxID=47850 RepID=UPI0033E6E1F5